MSVSVAGGVSSPPGCSAPFVSDIVPLARAAGASWLSLRPSRRSFSRWVVVVHFSSFAAASGFASPVAGLLPAAPFPERVPFCLSRQCGRWWCVSVPVAVVSGVVPVSVCPVFFASV